jgi:hypothetical protein
MKLVCLVLILFWGVSAVSMADTDRQRGGGHDIPTPLLSEANTHVELADGEIYTVAGKVMFDNKGQPFLKVDLDRMPWLASSVRQANPTYVLEGAPSFWKKYENTCVKYTCEAHGTVTDESGNLKYVISLGPIDGDKYKIVKDCPSHGCGD